jgi:RHS repeat-associated protein
VVQVTDPLGRITTTTYNARGWAATVTDPLGNVTTHTYTATGKTSTATTPGVSGGATDSFAYDNDDRLIAVTDPLVHTTTTTYDAVGNPIAITDPLSRVTTTAYDARNRPTTITDPLGATTVIGYDSGGNRTTVTDANSHVTTTSYDASNRPTVVTDPLGHATTTVYDAANEVTQVTDPLGRVTTTVYDANGETTRVIDPLGNITTLTYTATQKLATTTRPGGVTTSFTYDAADRLVAVTDPLNHTTTTVYDAVGNPIAVTDPLNHTTSYAYDAGNRLTTVTDALGHATLYGYDGRNNRVTTTDPLGRVTTITFDLANRWSVVTDPLGHSTTTTYDAANEVTQVTDPLGRVTTTVYDSGGEVTQMTDPLGHVTTLTYTATRKLVTATVTGSAGAATTSYTYDNADRLVAVTDPLGHATTTTYDAVGNTTAVADPLGHVTSYAYDAANRLTTVTDALGETTVTGYDGRGNKTKVTDPNGHTTTTAYDAADRATTVTDADGGVTTTAYDAAGRVTGLTDSVGNRTTWAYDAANRLTTLTSPNGSTTTYVYDNDHELTDTTDQDGRRVTYSYDSGGRQVGETWVGASPAETITSTYDADGELTAQSDTYATLTFTYDSGGKLLTAATSSPGGQPAVTLTSGYDAANDRTSLGDGLSSAGVTTFAYDQASRMTTLTTSYGGTSGPRVLFGYDAAGRMTSVARTIAGAGTAVTTSLAYDNVNRVASITHQIAGGASLASLTYVYDSGGRLAAETNQEGAVSYAYDATGQLTGVSGARAETYTYDSGGNRTMTGYATATGNETTSGGGYTYTYDNAGNLTAKTQALTGNVWAYSWDDRNRMTGVVEHAPGGSVLMQGTYTYDSTNRRIGVDETVGGVETKTWTVYDGVNPYADFNGSGVLQERYLYGPAVDEVLARTNPGGTTAWYLADKLGSIRDVANASGTVIDHVAYDAYGKVTSESSPANGDTFKYTGQEYDAATGLYFYRARYYDPITGRFISQDPSGFAAGDPDLYRYVGNGPTNATDPTGMASAAGLVGGSFGGLLPSLQPPPRPFVGPPTPYSQMLSDYTTAQSLVQAEHQAWSMANPGTGGGPRFDGLNYASNLANGFANTITGGLSSDLQHQLGNDVHIDPTSPEYRTGGQLAQAAQLLMMQRAAALALCRMATLSAQAAQAAAAARALMIANAAANTVISGGENAQGAYDAYQRGDYWGVAWSAVNVARNLISLAGLFGTNCFAAGTPLLTPDGDKPIESFQVGDWILSADQKIADGPIVARRVVRLFQNTTQVLILDIGGQSIRTTGSHPFWADGRGWTRTDKLREGDRLRSHDGSWVVVAGVRDAGETAPVYNLEVAEDHTYFVGAEAWGFSVWAHNDNACTTWQQHEAQTGQVAAEQNPGAIVAPQVTLDVTNNDTGDQVRIRPDWLISDPENPYQYAIAEAKFAQAGNLQEDGANLASTLTPNQAVAFPWLAGGAPVTVIPVGGNATAAGIDPGIPITITAVNLWVNGPNGPVPVIVPAP